MTHRREVEIDDVDCPRCGCYLKRKFVCNCGSVHSDVCDNCGRFTTLGRTEHIEMCLIDQPCNAGPVLHDHTPLPESELRRRYEEAARKMNGAS